MTIRTRRTDDKYRYTNGKDWTGDTKQRITPQAMPDLPEPFEHAGDCHWLLWHDPVQATLWYDRQCALWTVRFNWPDISQLQFKRDTPAMEMREKIIKAIRESQ